MIATNINTKVINVTDSKLYMIQKDHWFKWKGTTISKKFYFHLHCKIAFTLQPYLPSFPGHVDGLQLACSDYINLNKTADKLR